MISVGCCFNGQGLAKLNQGVSGSDSFLVEIYF